MNVLYVSGTRADFGLMLPVLQKLEQSQHNLHVFACNMHLDASRGNTLDEITKEGFAFTCSEAPPVSDTSVDQTKYALQVQQAFLETVVSFAPDAILLLGDRWEVLLTASLARMLGLLVLHVHGGEKSGIDDNDYRHAIDRLAHLHFVSCQHYKQRLLTHGEPEASIHVSGAPAIDRMANLSWKSYQACQQEWGFAFDQGAYNVLLFHPEDKNADANIAMANTIADFMVHTQTPTVCLAANNDLGSNALMGQLEKRFASLSHVQKIIHLPWEGYVHLLRNAKCLIGNSSSAIIEAPFLRLPSINIGSRQRGRFHASNVIHADIDLASLKTAWKLLQSHALNISSEDQFVFGRGNCAEKILCVLNNINLQDQEIRWKKLTN